MAIGGGGGGGPRSSMTVLRSCTMVPGEDGRREWERRVRDRDVRRVGAGDVRRVVVLWLLGDGARIERARSERGPPKMIVGGLTHSVLMTSSCSPGGGAKASISSFSSKR